MDGAGSMMMVNICVILPVLPAALLTGCTLTLGGAEREYVIEGEMRSADCHVILTRSEQTGDDVKSAEVTRKPDDDDQN